MAEQSSDITITLSSEMEAVSIASSSSAVGLQPMSEEEVEKRYQIIMSIGEECIQEEELHNLLAKKVAPICYDGFEPSGKMHIAHVLVGISMISYH